MDAAANATHRVAVFGEIGDPHPLAEILCDVLHENRTDAVIHAHQAPAVLIPRMTAGQAAKVVELLNGLGVQAAAVVAAELPNFDAATVVHHAVLGDEKLDILDYRGDVAERIAWPQVALLAIGDVPLETARRDTGTTQALVTSAGRSGMSTVSVPVSAGPEMWWITADNDKVYRLDHRQMNYETLGQRMTDSATANFRLFAAEFASSAVSAWKTPAARAYLDHQPAGQYTFDSPEALQRQALLHWVMAKQAKG